MTRCDNQSNPPYVSRSYTTDGGISIRNGGIDLPAGPGMGITIDEGPLAAPIASFT
jgi:L-alanine-DL-glutamate epimerase-like enolase superfamily enzyme